MSAKGLNDVLDLQIPAALGNSELTAAELREIAIFLTHYIGWPLGARLSVQIDKSVRAGRARLTASHSARLSRRRTERTTTDGEESGTCPRRPPRAPRPGSRTSGRGCPTPPGSSPRWGPSPRP
ncbi:hypothetical protein [Nonomuraea sp. MG754425]|uniref:hypothetical protein n=1 Tax=Nonomuraea sp. MG754425 TaxID=2570319 RepID=UPI0034D4D577